MEQASRDVLKAMIAKGYTDVEVKVTYQGYRSPGLIIFNDVIIAKKSLTHLHVRDEDVMDKEALGRLQPGDRVLITATPSNYTSRKHPDNTGVSLTGINIVKRLIRTRAGKLHGSKKH
jgi:hypothetical protein